MQFEHLIYIKYIDVLEQNEETTEMVGVIGEVKRSGFYSPKKISCKESLVALFKY